MGGIGQDAPDLLSATAGVTDRILDLKRKWYKGRDKRTGLISGNGTAYLANCG